MFVNFLKRKRQFDDAAKLELAGILAQVLKAQMTVAAGISIEDEHGSPKRKALGYVYGFIDAALRVRGQDMADLSIGVPVTYQVIRALWPENVNKYMDFLVKNINSDALMITGVMHGGQQYLDYRKAGTAGVPMGLARFIIEGDN
jgi:hypothetical protein